MDEFQDPVVAVEDHDYHVFEFYMFEDDADREAYLADLDAQADYLAANFQ